MTKFADQWEPNGPFGIVTDSNMSGGYRVVTNDADKSDITILPPERQKVGMLVYVSATGKTWRLTTVGVRSPGTETYSSAPVFVDASTGTIGGSIDGGSANSVLFISSAGLLAQDANLKYYPSTQSLVVGTLDLGHSDGRISLNVPGDLNIGNDSNVGLINIGTADTSDSVIIGQTSGPATYVNSDLEIPSGSLLRPKGGIFTGSLTPLNINTALGSGKVIVGNSSLGVDVSGPASFSGIINANGGIGISSGTTLNVGNDATITNGINVGTVSATGAITLGSAVITGVNVTPVLNANGGIGRSTDGALNIGNDANVTTGIAIGTASATGGVSISRIGQNTTINGDLVTQTIRPATSVETIGTGDGASNRYATVYATDIRVGNSIVFADDSHSLVPTTNLLVSNARLKTFPASLTFDGPLEVQQDFVGAAGTPNPTLSPGAVSTNVGVMATLKANSGRSATSVSATEDYPLQVATTWGPNLQAGAIKVRLIANGVETRGFIRVWFTPVGA